MNRQIVHESIERACSHLRATNNAWNTIDCILKSIKAIGDSCIESYMISMIETRMEISLT